MTLHQSSINYKNFIRDLADMYPFDVGEVIILELAANSLDAKASRISINFDPLKKILIIEDNGKGMSTSEFEEYHDFAAGLKERGTGIGFAGLGAKISFNIADKVVTETQSDSFSGGSNWYFQSNKKLVWEKIEPYNLKSCGTRVEVHFKSNSKLPYSSTKDLVSLLHRHYLPLIDLNFLDLYNRMNFYSNDFRFFVNGHLIKPIQIKDVFNLANVKEFYPTKGNKKCGYGILGVSEKEYPIAPDLCGVLLCTYGKVIKTDLFNQFPGSLGPRLFGIVEVPDFVKFLTTAKTDFIYKRKYRNFEKLYAPIRQEFKTWLRSLGLETEEIEDINEARKLERELKKLIDGVPELADFFGFRNRKSILTQNPEGQVQAKTEDGADPTFPFGKGNKGDGPGPLDIGENLGQVFIQDEGGTKRVQPISRTSRQGPKISFANRPDRPDMAWVEGNQIILNTSHPSYDKVSSNAKAKRVYQLFAIANAVQKFKGSESETLDSTFIDRMMTAWGKVK